MSIMSETRKKRVSSESESSFSGESAIFAALRARTLSEVLILSLRSRPAISDSGAQYTDRCSPYIFFAEPNPSSKAQDRPTFNKTADNKINAAQIFFMYGIYHSTKLGINPEQGPSIKTQGRAEGFII